MAAHKSFLQRKRCDLQIGSERHSGEEAEDKLTALLGYEQAARGASQERHWGIPGLLWVEQGSGQDLRPAVEYAGDHLKSALNSLLGEVASSGGDEIIQEVSALRSELLTGTGRPRGEYDRVGKLRVELEEKQNELQDRVATYRADVDRLGELRLRHHEDANSKPWEQLWQEHAEVEQRFRQVKERQEEQDREQKALETSKQTLIILEERHRDMAGQLERLEQRERELADAQRLHQELKERSPMLQSNEAKARDVYHQAQQVLQQARAKSQREKLEQDTVGLQQRIEELDASILKVQDFQSSLNTAREQLRDNDTDENALQTLHEIQRDLDETSIRLQVVATGLRYELDDGKTLSLNGANLAGSGEQHLLEESELLIPGIGRLQITPGGEDVGKLRRQMDRLKQDQAAQLEKLNSPSLEEAERRVELRRKSLADVQRLEALLESVAPKGLEALLSEKTENQQRLHQCQQELAMLPEQHEGEGLSLSDAETSLQTAELALQNAEAALRDHQTALARAEQNEDSAHREARTLRAELSTPERGAALESLEQQLRNAKAQIAQLENSLLERKQKIAEAQPDFLQLDMDRLSASARQAESSHQQRAIDIQGLQSRLEVQGAEGLEEKYNAVASELEQTNRRYNELRRRAEALDLLLALLQDKRQALTRRLQAPLQKHLDRYLALLFPKARLDVDENLQPGKFERDGELGHMDELSFGAREQLALLSRLAYADLLKEAGRPTLILLDDSLVHSDSERLAQMKRIIFDAAQRHQILLFTCHPDNWRDLGVAPQDLRALKRQHLTN